MIKRKIKPDEQTKFESYPENWDFNLAGKRVQLIKTNDPYTKLKEGDLGTVEYVIRNSELIGDQVSIQWDTGSNLMLIIGVDQFLILDGSEVIEVE